MNIYYNDEYDNTIHNSPTGTILPTVGDTISIDEDDWLVKSRVFYPAYDAVVIIITQNMIKTSQTTDNTPDRLNEVRRAIIDINKRHDQSEKKNRALNEQLASVKKHIQQSRQEKKDTKND